MRSPIGPLLLACTMLAACGQADKGKATGEQAAATAAGATSAAAGLTGAAQPAAGAIPTGTVDRSAAGTPAPAVPFEAKGSAKPLTMADFRGQRVLVNLWATWCAPCIKEMPMLDRLAARAGDRLVVLPLSQDMEGWRAVDGFFTQGKFPALKPHVDSRMAFGAAIKARGLPVTILYDEQGREVWRINGDYKWDGPEAAKLLGV